MADWVVSHYALTAKEQLSATEDNIERWKVLQVTTSDLSKLRRGDHSAGRLALQQAKFDEEIREVTEARQRRENPKVGLTPEAIRMIEREMKLM